MGTTKESVKTEVSYQWWIASSDEYTTRVIIDDMPGIDSEEIEVAGNGLRAWPCDFKLVDKLKTASATSLRPLLYRVYNRRGGSQIRRVQMFEPSK